MKCPILSAPTSRTAFTEHFADIECLKDECAWWDESAEYCAILGIELKLGAIMSCVGEIMLKMPHEEQFRK